MICTTPIVLVLRDTRGHFKLNRQTGTTAATDWPDELETSEHKRETYAYHSHRHQRHISSSPESVLLTMLAEYPDLQEATIKELQHGLAAGLYTSHDLVRVSIGASTENSWSN
jgi:hypothetical protein